MRLRRMSHWGKPLQHLNNRRKNCVELSWETIKDFIISFGWAKGTLTVLFWVFHVWIYMLYNARLKDKQKEIDRLAQENREYKEIFTTLLGQRLDNPTQVVPPAKAKRLGKKTE
jgi:hypothetical protein